MTTNNAVNVGLSGATGSGSFVGATSPTLVTPTLGVATATTIAFSPTTGGIIGTTAADSASAGNVGEYISSVIASGSAVSMSNFTAKTITSISLTAGDWDVWGEVYISAANTTTIAQVQGAINTTTNTIPTLPGDGVASQNLVTPTSANWVPQTSGVPSVSISPCRINISTTTTIFLVGIATFGTSTLSLYGKIAARRRR